MINNMNSNTKRFKERLMAAILSICILLSGFAIKIDTEAASAKVTVYVVTKITSKKDTNLLIKFNYNKNGLVSKSSNKYFINEYSYKKKQVSNIIQKQKDSTYEAEFKVSRDKKGRIKEIGTRAKNPSEGVLDWDENYKKEYYSFKYNKKNKWTSYREQTNGVFTDEYKYDSKGKTQSWIRKNYMGGDGPAWVSTYEYTYDKKGYVNSVYHKNHSNIGYDSEETTEETTTLKNTYKKGRLVKRNDYKITYKKIKVPKANKKAIEKQQRTIIESNTGAFSFAQSWLTY